MENKFFIEATYTPLMAIMGVSPLQIAKFIEKFQPRDYIIKPAGAFPSLNLVNSQNKNLCIFNNFDYFRYLVYFREYARYQLSRIEENSSPFDWGLQTAAVSIMHKISKIYICSLYKFRRIYPDGSIGLCSSFNKDEFEIDNDVDANAFIKYVTRKTRVDLLPPEIWFYNLQDICPAMIGIENMQNPNRFFIHSSEMLWEDFLREYIKIFAEGE